MSLSLSVCVPPQKAGFMLLESAFASEPGDRRNGIIIVSHIRAGTMAGNGQMMYVHVTVLCRATSYEQMGICTHWLSISTFVIFISQLLCTLNSDFTASTTRGDLLAHV